MTFFRNAVLLAATVSLLVGVQVAEATPDDLPLVKVTHEPSRYLAQTATLTRERICLNGEWEVKGDPDYPEYNYGLKEPAPPIPTDEKPSAEYNWHPIRVPGWIKNHPVWRPWSHDDVNLPTRCQRYWYRRNIAVPADWQGDQVVISFDCTGWLATVYLNGEFITAHKGQAGIFEADITESCTYGGEDELWVSLVRSGLEYGGGRLEAHILENSHWHFAYGIWGDVFLLSRPRVHVSDVFIRPSYRNKRLAVTFTVANRGEQDAPVTVESRVLDSGDVVLKLPRVTRTIKAGSSAVWDLKKAWADPHLWMPNDPHLYILETTVRQNGKVVDIHRERFGFQESWTEDGHIYLNGRRMLCHQKSRRMEYQFDGVRAYVRQWFRYLKATGFNMVRLQGISNQWLCEIADEEGMMIKYQSGWHHPNPPFARDLRDNVRRVVEDWVTRDRNHPSIVMWCGDNETWPNAQAVEELKYIDQAIREFDPTRPVDHEGVFWGALNSPKRQEMFESFEIWNDHYPDLRNSTAYLVDYVAEWAEERKRPVFFGEWGLGGAGTNGAVLGGNDYYRRLAGMQLSSYDLAKKYYDAETVLEYLRLTVPRMRLLQVAGIEDWSSHGLEAWPPMKPGPSTSYRLRLDWDRIDTSGWKPEVIRYSHNQFSVNPGFFPDLPSYELDAYHRKYRELWAPVYVFFPDYAWAYRGGEALKKDIAVMNDSMAAITARVTWQLKLEGTDSIWRGRAVVDVAQGERVLVPVSIELPPVAERVNGQLRVRALVPGHDVPEYTLDISVFPKLETVQVGPDVALYDPIGKTAQTLAAIGLSVETIGDPSNLPASVNRLIIGEGALDDDAVGAAVKLRDLVAAGGTVICLAQQDWNKWLPVRLALDETFQPTHAYPVAVGHPLLEEAGLGEHDYRNWHGHTGRLAYHSLAKPAVSRALPLLESGRVMNETPLLEVREGGGRYIICQLLLGDRAAVDPCAERVLRALCLYEPSATPTVAVGYLGNDAAAKLLTEELGLEVEDMATAGGQVWSQIGLLVTSGKPQQMDKIDTFVRGGGTWLALAQEQSDISWLPDAPGLKKSRMLPVLKPLRRRVRSDDSLLHQALRIDHELTTGISNAHLYSVWSPIAHYVMTEMGPWTALADPAVLAMRSYGQGRIIASSFNFLLPAKVDKKHFPRENAQRVLNTLLVNLGAEGRDLRVDLDALAGEFFTVDISKQANIALRDEVAGDKKGGWSDQGDSDMRNFPVGLHRFAGIPFDVIDADKNNGKSAIGLLSTAHADWRPQKVTVPFGDRKAKRLYFLHSAAWGGSTKARYFINYSGVQEKSVSVPIVGGKNITDWTRPQQLPEAVFEWENPHPDEPINSLSLVSGDSGAVLVIIGITGQN